MGPIIAVEGGFVAVTTDRMSPPLILAGAIGKFKALLLEETD